MYLMCWQLGCWSCSGRRRRFGLRLTITIIVCRWRTCLCCRHRRGNRCGGCRRYAWGISLVGRWGASWRGWIGRKWFVARTRNSRLGCCWKCDSTAIMHYSILLFISSTSSSPLLLYPPSSNPSHSPISSSYSPSYSYTHPSHNPSPISTQIHSLLNLSYRYISYQMKSTYQWSYIDELRDWLQCIRRWEIGCWGRWCCPSRRLGGNGCRGRSGGWWWWRSGGSCTFLSIWTVRRCGRGRVSGRRWNRGIGRWRIASRRGWIVLWSPHPWSWTTQWWNTPSGWI